MADQNEKPKPFFTFGNPPASSSSTSTPPLFGTSSSSTTTPVLFGGATSSSSTAPPLFGATTSSSAAPPLFGATSASNTSGAATSSLFGNFGSTTNNSKPAATTAPSTSAGSSMAPPDSVLFNAAHGKRPPLGDGTPESTKNLFGAKEPVSHTPLGAPSGNLFGSLTNTNQQSTGSTLFGSGQTQSQPSGSGLFGATQPSTGGSGLFGSNTTQPQQQTSSAGAGTGLFGGAASKPSSLGSNALGTTSASGSGAQTPGTSAPSTSNIFASLGQQKSGTSTPTGNLFGGAASTTPASTTAPSGGLFNLGQTSTTPASGSSTLFGGGTNGAPKPAASGSATSGLFNTAAATSSAPPAGGLFGNTNNSNNNNNATGTAAAAATTSAPAPKQGLFGTQAPTTSSATGSLFSSSQAGSQSKPATSSAPFSLFPSSTSQASAPATTSASAPGGLFGSQKPAASSSQAPPTTTSTSTPAGGLFGASAAAPSTTAAPTSTTPSSTTAAPGLSSAPAGGAGASTATAAPASTATVAPSGSRLAHKSMDEVLTMWSTSLSAHQKSFQNLAKRVSAWDRELVENSMKISTLYGRCFQAERDCSEIERQLTNMEHSQHEISSLLDKYEDEVDKLMGSAGVGEDGIGGVDAERERTYKTAENCSTRLNELSHSLTDMVEEINTTSGKLSGTQSSSGSAANGDPLGQIVRVLNGHLVQLQTIGSGAETLREQVAAAQREARNLSSQGLNGGNAWVDDFGRSYLGRR